jgi:hypothetical protein
MHSIKNENGNINVRSQRFRDPNTHTNKVYTLVRASPTFLETSNPIKLDNQPVFDLFKPANQLSRLCAKSLSSSKPKSSISPAVLKVCVFSLRFLICQELD